MPRKRRSARAAVLAAIFLPIGAAAGAQAPATAPAPPSASVSGGATDDASFRALVDLVEAKYPTRPTRQRLLASARDGLLADLDPYSKYLSPADWTLLHRGLDAEFAGIGVFLDFYGNRPLVKRLLADSAAADAGLGPGDVILAIDGRPTEGVSMDDVLMLLPGKAGSTVRLRIQPSDGSEARDVEVVRRVVKTPSVRGGRPDARGLFTDYLFEPRSGIGYVRIAWMARDVPERVEAALKTLSASGMRGLILDLRSNSGGLLGAAVATADLFLDSGRIVSEVDRDGAEEIADATPGGYVDFPMAVLIDRGSASSTEILASALQDNGRAVLFGERSFGKGLVQELFPLGADDGIRLTVAAYRRPSGENIDRFTAPKGSTDWGVCPDPGNDVFVPVADYQAWAAAAEIRDRQLLPTPLELATQGPPDDRDPVLEKALAWLRARIGRGDNAKTANR
jgi:carboxyl-terminal processing protease